jgi:3-hydroxyacyl-[acyl-carrier-protein] dehydratase
MIVSVEACIPHRAPFLFVDEIVSVMDDAIEARRALRADEPYFAGHYPGNPIMPGVLLCEAVVQAGTILMSQKLKESPGKLPLLTRVQGARFKKMVRPGDTLLLKARISERLGSAWFLSGSASVNNQVAVTLEFAFTLADG